MASSVQIVPTWSYPYVEVIINDYSTVEPDSVEPVEDTSVKQAYAVLASKGKDNKFIKKKSRQSAIRTFGNSNWKKFGQPLLQALDASDLAESSVYIMRVMPENAAYSNAFLTAYYKADTAEDVEDAHLRKFRIKHTYKSVADIMTDAELKAEFAKDPEVDPDGFTGSKVMRISSSGRGTCGDWYSVRITQNINYERDFGIKMNNFEILSSESGLVNEATYVGSAITSPKYTDMVTLINDVLSNVDDGVAPVDIFMDEDAVESIYDAYVAFVKQQQIDLRAEYDAKAAAGASDEELLEIEDMIVAFSDDYIPAYDEFDIFFGRIVADTTLLPGIVILEPLTDSVDTEAEDYDAKNYYETSELVDDRDPSNPIVYAKSNAAIFTSTLGIPLYFGSNGYFDDPRTVIDPRTGEEVKWTIEQEVEECYKNAYNGTLDPAILSRNRIPLTFICDANYPDSVKEVMYDLLITRDGCPGYFDTGIINSIGTAQVTAISERFLYMTNRSASKNIQSYEIREYSTQKKRRVTIAYYIATHLVDHINNLGEHIPLTFSVAELDGIKDSLLPVISDYDAEIKDLLYQKRFNYFECIAESRYQRGVQNTAQKDNSDLLEENNVRTLYTMKNLIEAEVRAELYDFSDASVRANFVKYINAKYANWNGVKFESYTFTISTTRYEFNHSILHAYLDITFRGLNKQAIVEIDINRREYNQSLETTFS